MSKNNNNLNLHNFKRKCTLKYLTNESNLPTSKQPHLEYEYEGS